jgi:hypothetical protein
VGEEEMAIAGTGDVALVNFVDDNVEPSESKLCPAFLY